jgi:hypothetical protein
MQTYAITIHSMADRTTTLYLVLGHSTQEALNKVYDRLVENHRGPGHEVTIQPLADVFDFRISTLN